MLAGNEVLHRAEEIGPEAPPVPVGRVNCPANQHLREERVAQLTRGIGIAQPAAQVGDDRFVVGAAQVRQGRAAILGIRLGEADSRPAGGVKGRVVGEETWFRSHRRHAQRDGNA